MASPTAYHQLGQFIVAFQHLEGAVNDLLDLTSGGDSEATRILANDLEYGKRLNTADVLFARFVDLRTNTDFFATTDDKLLRKAKNHAEISCKPASILELASEVNK